MLSLRPHDIIMSRAFMSWDHFVDIFGVFTSFTEVFHVSQTVLFKSKRSFSSKPIEQTGKTPKAAAATFAGERFAWPWPSWVTGPEKVRLTSMSSTRRSYVFVISYHLNDMAFTY